MNQTASVIVKIKRVQNFMAHIC